MTTEGGNWKELTRAATDGDLSIVKYHLDKGIDPNFQHPEFLTTPLIEAARAGNMPAVKLLLDHPPKTRPIPRLLPVMEEAMKEKHHDIVDILLRVLPEDYENECLTIWMTGTYHRDLVAHFLNAGHCVLITVDSEEADTIAEHLRVETRNEKIWVRPKSTLQDFFGARDLAEWRPPAIDIWLHKPNTTESMVKELVTHRKPNPDNEWTIPFRGGNLKVLFLMDSKSLVGDQFLQEQLAWLLAEQDTISSSAILEPATWWDTMTYSFWYQTWCDAVLGILTGMASEPGGGFAVGKAYTYDRQSVVLPTANRINGDLRKGWKHELRSIAA
jgi:Ankyrin repeats (3 copies)